MLSRIVDSQSIKSNQSLVLRAQCNPEHVQDAGNKVRMRARRLRVQLITKAVIVSGLAHSVKVSKPLFNGDLHNDARVAARLLSMRIRFGIDVGETATCPHCHGRIAKRKRTTTYVVLTIADHIAARTRDVGKIE